MDESGAFDPPPDIKPIINASQQQNYEQNYIQPEEVSSPELTSNKVAEVFITAGFAFKKLGDLAIKLRTPISENSEETKWDNRTVERLKDALTRFANELEDISETVQSRTVAHIKTDIIRKTNVVGDRLDPLKTPSYSNTSAQNLQPRNY